MDHDSMKIIYSSACLGYQQPGHPESPQRVQSTYEHLKDLYPFLAPEEIDENILQTVHTGEHVDSVRTGSYHDVDTPYFNNIFDIALLSVAASLTAVNIALEGELVFSLMRPPGHHAKKDSPGGFCYFNNIAIATTYALSKVRSVAIIDFDAHHGNGTQDIFLGHDRVLYLSTHQSPLYPGTGIQSEQNCRNYPLPAGTDEKSYIPVFKQLLNEVHDFNPDMIAVSAGFDAYRGDPLTGMNLDIATFEKIGSMIVGLGKPVFAVLEGGYASELKQCVHSFLRGLESIQP